MEDAQYMPGTTTVLTTLRSENSLLTHSLGIEICSNRVLSYSHARTKAYIERSDGTYTLSHV